MPRHPNRRTVVRTAVWTVPAVAVATAAPALAVSAPKIRAILTFDTFTFFRADWTTRPATRRRSRPRSRSRTGQQTNGPTITSLTLTVSYPDTRTNGGAPTIVSGPGWSFATPAHTGGNWVYTFLFVGSIPISRSTPELDFRVPLTLVNNGQVHHPRDRVRCRWDRGRSTPRTRSSDRLRALSAAGTDTPLHRAPTYAGRVGASRRGLLLAGSGLLAAGCSTQESDDASPSPTVTSASAPATRRRPLRRARRPAETPAALPDVTPWRPGPGELVPACKLAAVRRVEGAGNGPDTALQVIDAQYGGLLTDTASVLVVTRSWRRAGDRVVPGGHTYDVRLSRAGSDLAGHGGPPLATRARGRARSRPPRAASSPRTASTFRRPPRVTSCPDRSTTPCSPRCSPSPAPIVRRSA